MKDEPGTTVIHRGASRRRLVRAFAALTRAEAAERVAEERLVNARRQRRDAERGHGQVIAEERAAFFRRGA